MSENYCLFETPIGTGAIVWAARGVRGVLLPEANVARLRARLIRRYPGGLQSSPPADIDDAIARMRVLLEGKPSDLGNVLLDMRDVDPFDRRVYDVARTIPAGETLSYGQLAERLGDARLAREVGQALARNPFPIVVPCHRVIAAHGRLGGFSARGGVATKQRLLAIERANVSWQPPLIDAFSA